VAERAELAVNPIIYAEVSIGFELIEELEDALPKAYFKRHAFPWEAAFLAGKCFVRYRRAGGVKLSPLPDFLYAKMIQAVDFFARFGRAALLGSIWCGALNR